VGLAGTLEPTGSVWRGELDYVLPVDRIAQTPSPQREDARLMVVDRARERITDSRFSDLPSWLHAGDLLIANDSKVLPARLLARRATGGRVELLVLGRFTGRRARALVRSGGRLHAGERLEVGAGFTVTVVGRADEGRIEIEAVEEGIEAVLAAVGSVPLPPYIHRPQGPTSQDGERYQTVYASVPGSVAAPTAGLHLSHEMLARLEHEGVAFRTVTLHVGPGTFQPVRGCLDTHVMEAEQAWISAETAEACLRAKALGGRVVAVGTTSVRALESAAARGPIRAFEGPTDLFIRPGHVFGVVDALVTNFHLPGSTLLALVMSLAGRDLTRAAYERAVCSGYRFYSYGDAMLIL
jgi:S-adenosylmethionine:tRNA ribosyltransferase-isomerase